MTDKEVKDRVLSKAKEGNYGLCSPPMDRSTAISELCDFLLGEHYYDKNPITMPLSDEQIITNLVYDIERNYKNSSVRKELIGRYGSEEQKKEFKSFFRGLKNWVVK